MCKSEALMIFFETDNVCGRNLFFISVEKVEANQIIKLILRLNRCHKYIQFYFCPFGRPNSKLPTIVFRYVRRKTSVILHLIVCFMCADVLSFVKAF